MTDPGYRKLDEPFDYNSDVKTRSRFTGSTTSEFFWVEKDGKRYVMESKKAEWIDTEEGDILFSPTPETLLKLDVVNRLQHDSLLHAVDFYFAKSYNNISKNTSENINLFIVYPPLSTEVKQWVDDKSKGRYGFPHEGFSNLISAVLFLNQQNRYLYFNENSILVYKNELVIVGLDRLIVDNGDRDINEIVKEQFNTLALQLFKLFTDRSEPLTNEDIERLKNQNPDVFSEDNLVSSEYGVEGEASSSVISDLWGYDPVRYPDAIRYFYPDPEDEREGRSAFTDMEMIQGKIVNPAIIVSANPLFNIAINEIINMDLNVYAEYDKDSDNGFKKIAYGKSLGMEWLKRTISLANNEQQAIELAQSIVIAIFSSLYNWPVEEGYEDLQYNYWVISAVEALKGILFFEVDIDSELGKGTRLSSPQRVSPVASPPPTTDLEPESLLSPEEYELLTSLDNVSLEAYLYYKQFSPEELRSVSLTEASVSGKEAEMAKKITALDLPFYPGVFVTKHRLWQREFTGELLSSAIARMSLVEFKQALDTFVAALQMIDKTLGFGFVSIGLSDILVANNTFYLATWIVIDPKPFYDFEKLIFNIGFNSSANNEIKSFCNEVSNKISKMMRSQALEEYLYLRLTNQI